jgi:hypothetical protein
MTTPEKGALPEWAQILYKQLKEERASLEAEFGKLHQETNELKQAKQKQQSTYEKEITERTITVNNEILRLREQQQKLIESYRSELGKKVEELHILTKKLEEKQKFLEEKKKLLHNVEEEYKELVTTIEEQQRKERLKLQKEQEEEEERKRRALHAFQIPQNENWFIELDLLSPRTFTSPSTLAAVFSMQPDKYTSAVLQLLSLEGTPLLFAFAKALNDTLPNSNMPVPLSFSLRCSLYCSLK